MNKFFLFIMLLLAGLISFPPVAALAREGGCSGRMTAGYRDVRTDGDPARAAEYRLLDAGPVFGLQVRNDCTSDFNLLLDAELQDERDYLADLDLRYRDLWRLELQAEGLVHNLEHLPYQPGAPEARPDAFFIYTRPTTGETVTVPRVRYSDHAPGQTYGLEIDIYQAHLRGKLPSWPAHVNLTYWRFEREGEQQLRFVDENCASACHMQSTTRKVDRVTEEVRGGLDAHLGFFDVAIEQLFRQFRDKGETPTDPYLAHVLRPAGIYAHDPVPDARLVESSIKASTSPAGGFTAAAGFALGKRENQSDDLGATRIEAETDYYKANGDVTYTPGEHWTFNFRYRLLDLDAENNDMIRSDSLQPDRQPVAVREALDLRRAFYAGSVSFRPIQALTFKGDFRREDIRRDHTGGPVYFHNDTQIPAPVAIDPVWELPEQEVIDRYRLGLSARFLPKAALRLNSWAEYRTTDDPAYGTSFAEGREAFFGLNLVPGLRWGGSLNLRALDEENDEYRLVLFRNSNPEPRDLDRRREQQDVSAGVWVSPAAGVTVTANYAYMRTKIRQDLLFGSELGTTTPNGTVDYVILAEDTDYSQRVDTISAGLTWQIAEPLGLAVEGYRIRSEAEYTPEFPPTTVTYLAGTGAAVGSADASALREISRIDICQDGLKARLDLRLSELWSAGLEYTFDDYDDKNGDLFDGTVQTYMASLSRIW